MRARTATAVILLGLSALGVGACGSSDDAAGTVNEPITVGTDEVAVAGDTGAAAGGDTAAAGDSAAAGGDAAAGDPAAGKEVFASAGCAGCHTLADAGAAGAVGPNLDELKPDAATVAAVVTNGKGAMPPLGASMSPEDIANVAAYVSSVAGQ